MDNKKPTDKQREIPQWERLPEDISTMSAAEIEEYAKQLWERIARPSGDQPR